MSAPARTLLAALVGLACLAAPAAAATPSPQDEATIAALAAGPSADAGAGAGAAAASEGAGTAGAEDASAEDASAADAGAEDGAAPEDAAGSHSKLPLPRFVSLKSARVNLRVGPGRDYAVSWLYLKPGLPVEIVQEYELWRRIRDSEGTEGWVYHSLLSGQRTAIAAPWLKGKSAMIDVRRGAGEDATVVARMEPGVVSKVDECAFGWCEVEAAGRKGYVHQHEIWGVYPDERF